MTYESVDQLADIKSAFQQFKHTLHITATNSLRKGISTHNGINQRWLNAPILTFGQIMDSMGYGWYSSKTQLKQYTSISQYLRYQTQQNIQYNSSIFGSIEKNKDIVLRTIRMLEEAGITPNNVTQWIPPKPSQEEKLCLDIWSALEKENAIERFRKWFLEFQDTNETERMLKEVVIKAIMQSFDSRDERQLANISPLKFNHLIEKEKFENFSSTLTDQSLKDKRIVLHGFYFITPIQQRFIDALVKANYTVVHLINYREGYPSVFETVEEFLDFKQNTVQKVSLLPSLINQVSNKFINICEGDFSIDLKNSASNYVSFNHLYQFKNFVNHSEHKSDFLISPRAREVRRYLEDISKASNLKLKDYPIGQFLIDIHRISTTNYNEDTEQFNDREELNVDILLRIFASNYLNIDGIQSKKYMRDLEKIKFLLMTKTTFSDWIVTIEDLIEQQQLLEEVLTSPHINNPTIETDLYVLPQKMIAHYSVPIESLQAILKGLHNLKNLYVQIFYGNDIELNKFVDIIKGYIEDEVLPSISVEDEKGIAQHVLNTLEALKDDDLESFDRRDLIQGLRFFLSEGAESNQANSLFGESFQDGPIVSLQDGDILPFIDDEHVHLAFLDSKALPLSQNLVTWPFNNQSMAALYRNNNYLRLVQLRKNLDASITKYLIYLITENAASIKFSTVANFNSELGLQPSFYVELLDLPKIDVNSLTLQQDEGNQSLGYQSENLLMKKRLKSDLLIKTKDYCNKRFTFSYLLQDFPTFESDFHQRFVFQSLLSRYRAIQKTYPSSISTKEMEQFIYSWFPHWNNTKKDILNKKSKNWKHLATEYNFDNQIIFHDDLSKVALFGKKPKFKPDLFANAGPHCKYCPFQIHCKESVKENDK